MKKATEKVKGMLSGMATSMIDGDSREWPPTCAVLIYQPMRPCAKNTRDDSKEDNSCNTANQ